jgi:hypothetical protein
MGFIKQQAIGDKRIGYGLWAIGYGKKKKE